MARQKSAPVGKSKDIRSFFQPRQATTSPPISQAALPDRSPTLAEGTSDLADATADTGVLFAFCKDEVKEVTCDTSTELELSTDSSGDRATMPLAPRPPGSFVCPFTAPNGDCKTAPFKDLKGLAAHCSQRHPGRIPIPFEEDEALQDGTRRIPCLRNCGRTFATFDSAMQHVKKCDSPDEPRACPWPDCDYPPMKTRQYAAHTLDHVHDLNGKYKCDRCTKHWYDIYLLAGHRMRCEGKEARKRDGKSVFRSVHGSAETEEGPISIIAVARSSSTAPKSWKGVEGTLQDGIQKFARPIFDRFLADWDFTSGFRGTFLAKENVHTSVFPTPKDAKLYNIFDKALRSQTSQAQKFTSAIDKTLEEFAASGIKPILLSIGLDGFACKTDLILAWLQRSPPFTLVIRETELVYGLDEAHFPQYDSGFYYGIFDSAKLLDVLSTDIPADDPMRNLLDAWNACQAWKDTNPGRSIGRNGQPRVGESKKLKRVHMRE